MKSQQVEKCPVCLNCIPPKFSALEVIEASEDQHLNLTKQDASILFVLEGRLNFAMGKYRQHMILTHQALVIPANCRFKGKCIENSQLIIVEIDKQFFMPECFSFEQHQSGHEEINNELYYLSFNKILKDFLILLKDMIAEKLSCAYLLKLKVSELFLILKAFYSTEDMACFFKSCNNRDMQFSRQVYKLYSQYTNARQLAEAMNYSYSGFIKRFNRVFNKPPYAWIKEQKAHQVYQEITASDKNFNEISHELGFSSPARLTEFCKSTFKKTPFQIREERKKGKDCIYNGKDA